MSRRSVKPIQSKNMANIKLLKRYSGKSGLHESDLLRKLHTIQLSIPDKYFFVSKLRGKNSSKKKKNRSKNGILSGISLKKSKSQPKLDLENAREQIKPFHNSFKARNLTMDEVKSKESGVMTIQSMKEFRTSVRQAANCRDAGYAYKALDAIVTFIDLRNSSAVSGKQDILHDCLQKIGMALHEDGGLSMFHVAWFLTIYKEYLSCYRMFRGGELELVQRLGDSDAKSIAKKLAQKQFEVPHYLQLVDEEKWEMKQFNRYSNNSMVRASKHGQRGCLRADIKKIFIDKYKGPESNKRSSTRLNEINIIMAYAQLFAKIPMLYEVVESIKAAIPNINTETQLYRLKIEVSQKLNVLNIASGLYQNNGSPQHALKLYKLAEGIFNQLTGVIADLRLESKNFENIISSYPILKQAALLIIYKDIFMHDQESYIKHLNYSLKLLRSISDKAHKASAGHQISGQAAIFIEHIETIIQRVKILDAA